MSLLLKNYVPIVSASSRRPAVNVDENAEITKFHVVSKIEMRYAITNVETMVRNRHNETREVLFDMYIPKEAFVSNFSMTIKGKTYTAIVDVKEKAIQTYQESEQNAGLVETESQPEFTEGKHVSR